MLMALVHTGIYVCGWDFDGINDVVPSKATSLGENHRGKRGYDDEKSRDAGGGQLQYIAGCQTDTACEAQRLA